MIDLQEIKSGWPRKNTIRQDALMGLPKITQQRIDFPVSLAGRPMPQQEIRL